MNRMGSSEWKQGHEHGIRYQVSGVPSGLLRIFCILFKKHFGDLIFYVGAAKMF